MASMEARTHPEVQKTNSMKEFYKLWLEKQEEADHSTDYERITADGSVVWPIQSIKKIQVRASGRVLFIGTQIR